MLIRGLDVPWRDEARSARFDVPGFIGLLERQNPGIGTAQHDLLTALRHARSRSQEDPWGTGQHVTYAQAVLEIAVETHPLPLRPKKGDQGDCHSGLRAYHPRISFMEECKG